MSAKIDGSNGISYPDGTTQVTANIGALRNLIINGDMRVAQRGVSAALTAAAAYPSLDRWVANQATSANGILAQVAAGLIGFQYAAKLGRNSGATQIGAIWLSQSLESINSIPLQCASSDYYDDNESTETIGFYESLIDLKQYVHEYLEKEYGSDYETVFKVEFHKQPTEESV